MTTKDLIQEGNRIAELALVNYRDWFDTDDTDDQAIVKTIDEDLNKRNLLGSFYIREALADYKADLTGRLEMDPATTSYQDDIDLIDELFSQKLV